MWFFWFGSLIVHIFEVKENWTWNWETSPNLCSLTHTETELVSILLFYGIFLKWEIGASKPSSCDFYELTYWAQNECDSRRDTYLW